VESGEEILGTGSQNAGLWGIAMALEAFMGVHGPGLGDWRLQHPDRHTGCGTSHSQPGPLGDSSQGDLELTPRRRSTITVHWVPGHAGVQGGGITDVTATVIRFINYNSNLAMQVVNQNLRVHVDYN
jgi:hypothetical protein